MWRCQASISKVGFPAPVCGEIRYCDEPPSGPCPEGHSGAWRREEFSDAPGIVANTTASLPRPNDVGTSSATLARQSTTPDRRAVRERLSPERPGTTRRFRLRRSGSVPRDRVVESQVTDAALQFPQIEALLKSLWTEVQSARESEPSEMRLYFTVSTYADGRPGEIFVKADRTGTLASGALDAAATMVSMLLQYGVPLGEIISKLRHTRYEPAGFTGDQEFPRCTSPLDLLAQWLQRKFSHLCEGGGESPA